MSLIQFKKLTSWGYDFTMVHYKKGCNDFNDVTFISSKNFYNESEQHVNKFKDAIPLNDDMSSLIAEFIFPLQYNGIYVLKEVEWRTDNPRTVLGLTKCFMYPDYTFIMILTLKPSIVSLKDYLYYTLIRGTWQLRTDQENFREWKDPYQEYIDSLGPWRLGDEMPKKIAETKLFPREGFIMYKYNKETPANEHPKAGLQFQMNQEKTHYKMVDANHILFEVQEYKKLNVAMPSDEIYAKFKGDEEGFNQYEREMHSETFEKLRNMEWREAVTKSGNRKVIDWNCIQLDMLKEGGGLKAKCGGGIFGPRNPNWCQNPVYCVRRKLWRAGILGSDSKMVWEANVDDPDPIIMSD